MVSVLAIGPKVREFKPGQGDEFLKTREISSTFSIGREVKWRPYVVRFYDMLKIPSK
jgi:hypothetical protein